MGKAGEANSIDPQVCRMDMRKGKCGVPGRFGLAPPDSLTAAWATITFLAVDLRKCLKVTASHRLPPALGGPALAAGDIGSPGSSEAPSCPSVVLGACLVTFSNTPFWIFLPNLSLQCILYSIISIHGGPIFLIERGAAPSWTSNGHTYTMGTGRLHEAGTGLLGTLRPGLEMCVQAVQVST